MFVDSMGDLFHEDVPDDFIDKVFAVMALCPDQTFQVLTKRPERMREYFAESQPGDMAEHIAYVSKPIREELLPSRGRGAAQKNLRVHRNVDGSSGEHFMWPLPKVWLGVTAEDQQRANERIAPLLQTPAAVRFVSIEPMLGPVDLTSVVWGQVDTPSGSYRKWVNALRPPGEGKPGLDWVICGGESGGGPWPGPRPLHPWWPQAIRDQCIAWRVPFFFKQRGEWRDYNTGGRTGVVSLDGRWTHGRPAGWWMHYTPEPKAVWYGRTDADDHTLDGQTWEQFPRPRETARTIA